MELLTLRHSISDTRLNGEHLLYLLYLKWQQDKNKLQNNMKMHKSKKRIHK